MVTIQLSAPPGLASAARSYPPILRVRRLVCWVLVVVALLAVMLVARTGCERMIQAAPPGSTDGQGHVVAGYGWSLSPLGFRVRYRDGSSVTRLWW
jgi:hypothetical protein